MLVVTSCSVARRPTDWRVMGVYVGLRGYCSIPCPCPTLRHRLHLPAHTSPTVCLYLPNCLWKKCEKKKTKWHFRCKLSDPDRQFFCCSFHALSLSNNSLKRHSLMCLQQFVSSLFFVSLSLHLVFPLSSHLLVTRSHHASCHATAKTPLIPPLRVLFCSDLHRFQKSPLTSPVNINRAVRCSNLELGNLTRYQAMCDWGSWAT